MSSDYGYDEDGQLWPFFTFTVSSIAALPLTWRLLRHTPSLLDEIPRIPTKITHAHAQTVLAARKKFHQKKRHVGLGLLTAAAYAVAGYSLYLILSMETSEAKQIWNPYDILGIPESASEQVIKKMYKTLSRKFHPDKIKPDPAKNETVESLNNIYVEIGKAYQALTDETVRNNFLEYGHPDGKQTTAIKIALPLAIVSDAYGHLLVLGYFLAFGILLPYFVGTWWYGTLRRSRENVLMESANRIFLEYDDRANEASVIAALSTGQEFEELLPGDKAESGLATIEARITAPAPSPSPLATASSSVTVAGLTAADDDKLSNLDTGVRRKVLALFWAHLGRIDLGGDAALEAAKVEVAPIANALVRAYTAVAVAYGNTAPMIASMKTGQLFVQALTPGSSPLLQLPHVTPEIAAAIERSDPATAASARPVPMPVQRLMDLPDEKRRKLAVGAGRLTEEQYADAVAVAQQMPYLRVSKAFFKVEGEKHIIAGSLVQMVVKCRFIPPGFAGAAPAVDEADLQDIDPPQLALDAVAPKKEKADVGWNPDGSTIVSDRGNGVRHLPPLAHAPYFGREHVPRWYVFLTDSKQGKLVVPPFTFFAFDKPILAADGRTPTFHMQTFKAVFAAPPQAGQYTFVMHVISDSYAGLDTRMETTLVVRDPSEVEAEADAVREDDISEPDEDSIAGILSAAKGGPVKQRRDTAAAAAAAAGDEESDDESTTDEEASETSETDTDTEAED